MAILNDPVYTTPSVLPPEKDPVLAPLAPPKQPEAYTLPKAPAAAPLGLPAPAAPATPGPKEDFTGWVTQINQANAAGGPQLNRQQALDWLSTKGYDRETISNAYQDESSFNQIADFLGWEKRGGPAGTTAKYKPEDFTVGKDQLVEDRLQGIIGSDSALMQQAVARSRQEMNSRGLINSSMAVGAAQGALMDRALPIAQQDAQTMAQAAAATTQARNTALQFGATAENQKQLADLQANTQKGIADLQAKTQVDLQNIASNTTMTVAEKQIASQMAITQANNAQRTAEAEYQLQADLSKISADANVRLAVQKLSNDHDTILKTSQTAATLYQQSMTLIADIMRDPNITDKEAAIKNVNTNLDAALNFITDTSQGLTGVDLNFGPSKQKQAKTDFTNYVTQQSQAGTISKAGALAWLAEKGYGEADISKAYPDTAQYNEIASFLGWPPRTANTTGGTTGGTTPTFQYPRGSTQFNTQVNDGLTKFITDTNLARQTSGGQLTRQEVLTWLASKGWNQQDVSTAYPDDKQYNEIAAFLQWPTRGAGVINTPKAAPVAAPGIVNNPPPPVSNTIQSGYTSSNNLGGYTPEQIGADPALAWKMWYG